MMIHSSSLMKFLLDNGHLQTTISNSNLTLCCFTRCHYLNTYGPSHRSLEPSPSGISDVSAAYSLTNLWSIISTHKSYKFNSLLVYLCNNLVCKMRLRIKMSLCKITRRTMEIFRVGEGA